MEETLYDNANLCSEYKNITARWMKAVDLWVEYRAQNRPLNSSSGLAAAKKLAREAADVYLERLEHPLTCKRCQSRVSHSELREGQKT